MTEKVITPFIVAIHTYYILACKNDQFSIGNGSKQGTCDPGNFCHADGRCLDWSTDGICLYVFKFLSKLAVLLYTWRSLHLMVS